ncbi:MAG: AI-2E family transporter [Phycisphaerales bacterium JB054]
MADTPDPEQTPGTPSEPRQPRGDWKSLHLWQIQGVRDVLVVLGVLGLLWLGQKISIVTVPLLLAILFAYLFEPVIRWLMKRSGMKRQGAVTAVLAATILAIVVPSALGLTFGIIQSAGLVKDLATNTGITLSAVTEGAKLRDARAELQRLDPPPAEIDAEPNTEPDAAADGEPTPPPTDAPDGTPPAQTEAQAAEIEALQEKINTLEAEYQARLDKTTDDAGPAYRWIADFLNKNDDGENLTNALASAQNWLKINADGVATAGAGAIRSTINFFGSVFGLLFMAFITAFFFFFLATGWVEVQAFGAKLVPDKHRDLLFDLLTKFDAVISAFIRGRLTIAFIQAIVFTVGYLVIGVPAAFILGPLVAVLSIVPYLALVGLPISALLLALEGHSGFRGEWWWYLGAPTFIYFLGQALDDYVWTPLIQGKGTDMSTPMILFASLAGGALFGVFGLLIAIPIAACLKILIQEVFWPRFKAWAEGREQDFLPIDRA